jgi:hypothetical protein
MPRQDEIERMWRVGRPGRLQRKRKKSLGANDGAEGLGFWCLDVPGQKDRREILGCWPAASHDEGVVSAGRDTAAKTKNEKCSLDVPQDLAGALLSEGKDWPGGARIDRLFLGKNLRKNQFRKKVPT